jgi:hypothetical protein
VKQEEEMENTKLREALERVFFAAEDEVSTHGILGSDCKCPLCIAVAEYRAALREATPAATEGGEKLDMHKINRCPHCNHYHSSAQGCVPCPDCGGTGDGKWNEPAICTACNGTGKVDPASPSLPAKEERREDEIRARIVHLMSPLERTGWKKRVTDEIVNYIMALYRPAPQPAATVRFCAVCEIDHEDITQEPDSEPHFIKYHCGRTGKTFVGLDAAWDASAASRDSEIAALKAIAERYDILFDLYADHIHDHRLGCGKACSQCKELINAQIDAKVKP